ncbi:MAG: IS3 family transposase [Proteobacteria bacterium]|nr:IS3 family transposase [Pseudomonadota bacterium]
MATTTIRYTPEFKRQLVELHRSGRSATSLAKEFGPTAWTIGLWVKQAERDRGKGDGGLTHSEREELNRLRRENRKLKEEREILFKSRGLVRHRERSLEALFGFVKVNQATHPVGMMCRLLQISRSGYYAWLDRPMCARRREDLALTGKIAAIHRFSRETYGSPMIHAELAEAHGIRIGRKRVARLMRAAGLCGATLRKFVVTTMRPEQAPQVPDLVQRRFYAERPNRLWVADATYIPTWSGFLYLAIVLDVFSRKIVGWAMETHLRTELMLAAIDMAITMRRPKEVIHHSDQGCQYTSYAFGKRCQEAGIMPSMGTVGDAYDNAMAESFFATLEREVLNRRRFHSQAEAKMAIFDWLEGWYNPHRRHSALGRRSPVNYERLALAQEVA